MPDIAALHPQVVHFVVALGIIGVLLRIVSLARKWAWTSAAAVFLLIIAAGASVVAVESGHQAHEWAEQIPGVRTAVQEHEELGEKTRNIFLLVAALEVVALALRSKEKATFGLRAASAVVGIVACFYLYEAGEHGGELVYNYAGGIGTRSGESGDVQNLLIAGLFHQARVARQAGRPDEAARLTEEMARQRPQDYTIAVMALDARYRDLHDTSGALAGLTALEVPDSQWRPATARGMLQAEILVATGQKDSAKSLLTALVAKYPESRRAKAALEKLGS
ncbi:MAG TPA: DUF2231 domain-containing protein [Gemmatimonadales bacterium]|nr:DUF2231 domain-containing protein [Gemmatimonadales bacterium]